MSLTLYYHPLSSFCWKALIALYETGAAFEPRLLDFSDPEAEAAYRKIWPIRKFPLLRDETAGKDYPEATIIIEYLAEKYPEAGLIPAEAGSALETRLMDRLFDNYLNVNMQKIVGDRLRPEGDRDPFGVEEAKKQIETAYGMIETRLEGREWAAGDGFSMADCAAAPALFYANKVAPRGGRVPRIDAYFEKLKSRASFVRVLKVAEPYFHMFPEETSS